MTVTRPALRYFGGKYRLAPWIIENFPEHLCYVEPFGGGMGVMLRKQPSYHDVYNDLDGEVVNFFRVLRERPEELIRAIALTPFSREEQRAAFEVVGNELERARRLYVRSWQSHGGGRGQWQQGWRYEVTNHRNRHVISDWNRVDSLWEIVARLKEIQFECDDAIRVIERFDGPETLFYLDPPYLAETRSIRWRSKAYVHEIDDDYHRRLAELLSKMQGMAVISGYAAGLYDELYAGWVRKEKVVTTDFQSKTV